MAEQLGQFFTRFVTRRLGDRAQNQLRQYAAPLQGAYGLAQKGVGALGQAAQALPSYLPQIPQLPPVSSAIQQGARAIGASAQQIGQVAQKVRSALPSQQQLAAYQAYGQLAPGTQLQLQRTRQRARELGMLGEDQDPSAFFQPYTQRNAQGQMVVNQGQLTYDINQLDRASRAAAGLKSALGDEAGITDSVFTQIRKADGSIDMTQIASMSPIIENVNSLISSGRLPSETLQGLVRGSEWLGKLGILGTAKKDFWEYARSAFFDQQGNFLKDKFVGVAHLVSFADEIYDSLVRNPTAEGWLAAAAVGLPIAYFLMRLFGKSEAPRPAVRATAPRIMPYSGASVPPAYFTGLNHPPGLPQLLPGRF